MYRQAVRNCKSIAFKSQKRSTNSGTNSKLEIDLLLQNQYDGLMPRVMSLWSLLNDEGMEKLKKLEKDAVIDPQKPLSALTLFADLQNPLLKKYKFDPSEFIVGAKHGYSTISAAICSIDFNNFVNGFTNISENQDLLKDTLSRPIYTACYKATRDLHKAGVSTRLISNEISSFVMNGARTTVVTQEISKAPTSTPPPTTDPNTVNAVASTSSISEGSVVKVDETRGMTSETATASTSVPNLTSVDNDRNPAEELLPTLVEYPIGSVVASVDVLVETKETYETRILGGQDMTTQRSAVTVWTFEGCISGHTDLEWQVTAFDRLSGV